MSREIIAILRGIEPAEAADIGMALGDAGIARVEVPLNSPDSFRGIETLAKRLDALGCGEDLTTLDS